MILDKHVYIFDIQVQFELQSDCYSNFYSGSMPMSTANKKSDKPEALSLLYLWAEVR